MEGFFYIFDHLTRSMILRKLFFAFLLITISLTIGIMAYGYLEGYTIPEAFYMSVITISTVGFGEVRPLSTEGRIFTGIYIIFNLGIFTYFVSVVGSFIFEGEIKKIYQNLVSVKEVKKMKDHVIICGFGRNGMKAAEELHKNKIPFVIIERENTTAIKGEQFRHY